MELGTILVIIGIVLAAIAAFITNNTYRLLAAAVVLVGIGVLIGVGDLKV